jgi:Flp pilus assembly protein TadD
MKGSFVEAIPHLEKAVELSQGKDWQCLALLGTANFKAGRAVEAVRAVQRALDVAVQDGNSDVTARLRSTLESYQAMK